MIERFFRSSSAFAWLLWVDEPSIYHYEDVEYAVRSWAIVLDLDDDGASHRLRFSVGEARTFGRWSPLWESMVIITESGEIGKHLAGYKPRDILLIDQIVFEKMFPKFRHAVSGKKNNWQRKFTP